MGVADQLWSDVLNGNRADKRIKGRLTAKCKAVVIGNHVHVAGDIVELLEEDARALYADGDFEPTNPLAWVLMPPREQPTQQPEETRLDRPGNGGEFQVEVVAGKCVYLGGRRSYGAGERLFLTEEQARELLRARRIKLLKPDKLPAYLADKPKLPHALTPYGTSGVPITPAARIEAQP